MARLIPASATSWALARVLLVPASVLLLVTYSVTDVPAIVRTVIVESARTSAIPRSLLSARITRLRMPRETKPQA